MVTFTPSRARAIAQLLPSPWPWCMDQGCGRNAPYPVLGSCDAGGLRASQLLHAVQDLDRHVHLGRLTLVRVRAQPVSDHPLEAADRGLDSVNANDKSGWPRPVGWWGSRSGSRLGSRLQRPAPPSPQSAAASAPTWPDPTPPVRAGRTPPCSGQHERVRFGGLPARPTGAAGRRDAMGRTVARCHHRRWKQRRWSVPWHGSSRI